MMGYAQIQGTRPQTLAYGLADSPVGQLAWIVEKFKEWTDPAAELPEDAVDRDHMLTDVSIYWFTNTAGSSANLYYETYHDPSLFAPRERGTVPTGVAVSTTQDIAIRRFAERDHNIVHWTEFGRRRPLRGHGSAGDRRRGRARVLPRPAVRRNDAPCRRHVADTQDAEGDADD